MVGGRRRVSSLTWERCAHLRQCLGPCVRMGCALNELRNELTLVSVQVQKKGSGIVQKGLGRLISQRPILISGRFNFTASDFDF